MDIGSASEIIGSLGFPIACCAVLAWYIVQQDKKHAEEIKILSEAIDNLRETQNEIKELIYNFINNMRNTK